MQHLLDCLFFWLRPIIFMIPKRDDIWVFGSWFGKHYTDNTKILYEYCLRHYSIKPIWISKNKLLVASMKQQNLPAYYYLSPQGIYYCLVASCAFYNCGPRDISEYLIAGTKRIQLWHGVPIKKILYDDDLHYPNSIKGEIRRVIIQLLRLILPSKNMSWDVIISPSPIISLRYASAFKTQKEKIYDFGCPRHQFLFEQKFQGSPNIILYAPTHRKQGESNFDELSYIDGLDFEYLESLAEIQKFIFLIRLHPVQNEKSIAEKIQHLKRVKISSADDDIYQLLPSVQCLITDYSSVYIDFLVFNRPIIHYCFDHQNYLSTDRGLYEAFEVNLAGPVLDEWQSVLEYIESNEDGYQDKRMWLKEKFLGTTQRNSCQLIIHHLLKKSD